MIVVSKNPEAIRAAQRAVRYRSEKKWARGRAVANRLKHDGAQAGLDPKLCIVPMQLLHQGLLTEQQVNAGIEIAKIYGEYERAIGAPRRLAAGPHYGDGYGERVYGQREILVDDERAIRARKRMDYVQAVFNDLPVGHKHRIQATIEKLFVENLAIPTAELPSVHPVLDQAAVRLGFAPEPRLGVSEAGSGMSLSRGSDLSISRKTPRDRNGQIFPDRHPFREMIRPFADALADYANIQERARIQLSRRLVDAFDTWLGRIVLYRSPAIQHIFGELLQNARPLHDRLKEIDSAYRSPGPHSVFDNDPHWAIGLWLNDALKSTRPPVDIGMVLTGLSVIVQQAEEDLAEPSDPDRQRGRPFLDEYPGLALLIFRLEFEWLASLGSALPAYKKKNSEVQVAAGSLTEVLDALRKHILDAGWKWLADYLPPSDSHLRHVPTYQRILGRARKFAAFDRPQARASALEEGMKPFLRGRSTA